MERSHYNHVIDRNGKWIGYNARTGVFADLSEDAAKLLRSDGDIPPGELSHELSELGFLHDGNEIGEVISTYTGSRIVSGVMNVTIAPTIACNKSCSYCFQNPYRSDRMMTEEIQDATVDYIGARVAGGWDQVTLTWYGGEPLLAADIVEDLTPRIRRRVKDRGGMLGDVSIVTNGVLLDELMVGRLVSVGIDAAQISFDHLREGGITSRGLIDENGRPSSILSNAVTAAKRMSLAVRINVSRSNQADLERMIAVLADHGLDNRTYLARTDDLDGEAGHITQPSGRRVKPISQGADRASSVGADPDTLGRAGFARVESSYFDRLPTALNSLVRKLTPKTHFCGATNGSMFAIDPVGDISRCWESVGVPSEAMGNVKQLASDMVDTEVARRWAAVSPFLYPACAGCRVLPLCMGGCAHPRVFMDATKTPCEAIKFQIDEAVARIASIIKLPA